MSDPNPEQAAAVPPPREQLVEDLDQLLDRAPLELARIRARTRNIPPEDVASALSELDHHQKLLLFRAVSDQYAAQVLDEADRESQIELAESIGLDHLSRLIEEMPPDEGADFLALLGPEQRTRVLASLDPTHAGNLRELEKFDPETAGGLMTNEFLMVPPDLPAGEALTRFAEFEGDDEASPLNYVYIVDEVRNLLGVASFKQLIRTDPNEPVREVMQKPWVTVQPSMDREEVARIVDRYHLQAIPVTNDAGGLLGVVTVDDIMDVIEEEVSEDMYRMAGAAMHNPFVEPVWQRVWNRLPWLVVTMFGGFASVALISLYQHTIEARTSIAFFLPIVAALAGNIGVQASTIMVRGFATGDIPAGAGSTLSLLLRELAVGCSIGLICGVCTGIFAALYTSDPDAARLGLSVGLSIFAAISAAVVVGTLVPIACSRMGVDPALAAGPFIVTTVDLFAHLIYFVIVTLILFAALQ